MLKQAEAGRVRSHSIVDHLCPNLLHTPSSGTQFWDHRPFAWAFFVKQIHQKQLAAESHSADGKFFETEVVTSQLIPGERVGRAPGLIS